VDWSNPLRKKAILDSPVVEVTPVVWNGRLVLAECWREQWRDAPPVTPCVQIRDVDTGHVLARTFEGYSLASAFVWGGVFFLYGARREPAGERTTWNDVNMTCSVDLREWTEPVVALRQEAGENIFNQSVCRDDSRFVMAYETNDGVPFTIKFAESGDLRNWRKIEGAVLGPERYAACPAIRFAGGLYYVLYLERPCEEWWFETWLARSRDLREWELAPRNPVIVPDPEQDVHPDCTEPARECNASDPDLIEWRGKTRVYFTGGHQQWGGRLQYAEFDGPMAQFFEAYYA